MACAKGMGGMGFRGISDFNISLLGKHYWRLLMDEKSLVSKVLKGKYYPRSSIEGCANPYAPSYAWRSILCAKELIQKGSRWRIGNGERVTIGVDRWLPNSVGFKMHGAVSNLNTDARVCELIDGDLRRWKRDLIFSSFELSEATQIVSIPLSFTHVEDKLIWHGEKNGIYSVRSAYHLCRMEKSLLKPGPSSPAHPRLWKAIWKAPINNKIKNFLWRLVKNILPTKVNLLKKGVALDDTCAFCHSMVESADHLFLHCDFAKQLFFSSVLSYRLLFELDVVDWVESIAACGDKFGTQLLCTLAHKVWLARNALIYENRVANPISLAADALEAVLEFSNANHDNSSNLSCPEVSMGNSCNSFAVQVDASVFAGGVLALGCIIRDHNKNIVLATSLRDEVEVEPVIAEILALHWGIMLAIGLRIRTATFLSDALTVVDCVNSSLELAVIEPIATDCRILLENFNVSSVLFIRRSLNSDAHNLVKLGKNYGTRTWIGDFPSIDPSFNALSGFLLE